MESKNLVPIAGLIIVVVVAVALFLSFSSKPVVPTPETVSTSTPVVATSSMNVPTTPAPTTVSPAMPAAPTLPKGTVVTSETVWRSMTPNGWNLTLSAQTPWQVSISNDANGNPSYVSLSGATSAIVVSKDLHIATPSGNTPSITTQTIAGQSVRVSKYDNPQKGYVYSLSFSLPIKGSTYYVLFQSATSSMKTANDFISLIQAK